MKVMLRFFIIALFGMSAYASGCPWHSDPAFDPYAAAFDTGEKARKSDDYKEVRIRIHDRIKGTTQEFWPKGDLLKLPELYGWNCEFSHYVQGFELRSLECERGGKRHFTDIPCHPYQEKAALKTWDISDSRGVALASVELSCDEYVKKQSTAQTIDLPKAD